MGKKFGLSFSWRRAVGISAAKGKLARMTGVPLTRQGRQRKIGGALGCCLPISVLILTAIILISGVSALSACGIQASSIPVTSSAAKTEWAALWLTIG